MSWIWPFKRFQFSIKLGNFLIENSASQLSVSNEEKTKCTSNSYLSRKVANSFSNVAKESIADVFFATKSTS